MNEKRLKTGTAKEDGWLNALKMLYVRGTTAARDQTSKILLKLMI